MALIKTAFDEPPSEGQATEVAEGILWMRLPLPMALDHVNVYAIDDGDGWCIVDTGFHSKRGIDIWEGLLSGPLSGKPVTKVLLTHHHPDHIGMVGWFQKMGAALYTSRTSYLLGRMLTLDVQEEWSKESYAFYLAAGMPETLLNQRIRERPYNFADVVHPIYEGFHRLKDEDTFQLGARDWTVYEGNGHAPEQVTMWSKDGALVLAGDQLINGISSNIAVYPTEPDADPLKDWLDSCARFEALGTDSSLVLSGHKLPFYGLKTRARQLIEHHLAALQRLSVFIETPRAAADAFDLLYGRSLKPTEYGFALTEAVAHMNHLWAAGVASREKGPDGVYRFQKIPGESYGPKHG